MLFLRFNRSNIFQVISLTEIINLKSMTIPKASSLYSIYTYVAYVIYTLLLEGLHISFDDSMVSI